MDAFEQATLNRLAALAETWTIDELRVERDQYARHKRDAETEVLQRVLEKKVAEDCKPVPAAEWSKTETEKSQPLTPVEVRKKAAKDQERQARIASKDGTVVLFTTPKSPWKSQLEYQLHRNSTEGTTPKRDPRSCTTCSPNKRGSDCGGQCDRPGFFDAPIMSPTEIAAYDARRAGKE